MSTRSGKRINKTIEKENSDDSVRENIELNTRNKGKIDRESFNKTHKNYVKYPSEESVDTYQEDKEVNKNPRKSKRNTLRDRSNCINDIEVTEPQYVLRNSRKTKKNTELEKNHIESLKNHDKKNKKKGKNKKKSSIDHEETHETVKSLKKKTNKKKNKKTSLVTEDLLNDESKCPYSGGNTDKNRRDTLFSAVENMPSSPDDVFTKQSSPIIVNLSIQPSSHINSSERKKKSGKDCCDSSTSTTNLSQNLNNKATTVNQINKAANIAYEKKHNSMKEEEIKNLNYLDCKSDLKDGLLQKKDPVYEELTNNKDTSLSVSRHKDVSLCVEHNNVGNKTSRRSSRLNIKIDNVFQKSSKVDTKKFSVLDINNLNISNSCKKDGKLFNLNSTYEKTVCDNNDSFICCDTSRATHISVTSDESNTGSIFNSTPHSINSSIEEIQNNSKITQSIKHTKLDNSSIEKLFKCEDTFIKDDPEILLPVNRTSVDKTPTRSKSLASPGCTPFPLDKTSTKEKIKVLNVTHSIEKSRRSSLVDVLPQAPKVMFCITSNNSTVNSQIKRKVIKSSLKGSNKSFIFDESSQSSPMRLASRKRAQTQGAPEPRAKRSRLLSDAPAEKLRMRSVSESAKLSDIVTQTNKLDTPTKSKLARTKLPNFAALHQKQFQKMESLDECQKRKAKRAKQLLTPTRGKETQPGVCTESKPFNKIPSKLKTPLKVADNLKYGFKLNCDIKPFKFTAKNTDVKPNESKLMRQVTTPSLAGATLSRRDFAKQAIMREKSCHQKPSCAKTDEKRHESRTFIMGVRTNRRFELQMKMRNIND